MCLAIKFTYCTDTTCTTPEAQIQRSWNQKNRRIRPKPSMFHITGVLLIKFLITTRYMYIIIRMNKRYKIKINTAFTKKNILLLQTEIKCITHQ